jgi:hypothetical protein
MAVQKRRSNEGCLGKRLIHIHGILIEPCPDTSLPLQFLFSTSTFDKQITGDQSKVK